jgi:hypothetical protein
MSDTPNGGDRPTDPDLYVLLKESLPPALRDDAIVAAVHAGEVDTSVESSVVVRAVRTPSTALVAASCGASTLTRSEWQTLVPAERLQVYVIKK